MASASLGGLVGLGRAAGVSVEISEIVSGWALTPSGIRGVLNDAISIYFADATLARL
jgi:hypothetical protein